MPGVLPTPLLTSGGGGVALTLDASSPPLVVANATTVTTASFTPPVGSLLVAFAIGTSFSGNPNAVLTSTGLTFTSQLLNNGAGEGTVQVFTSLVGAAGGSARTVNLSVSGYASCGLKVYVLTGQHATLYVDNTASGTSTANVINAAITTNNDGCLVLGGASEFIGLGVPTTTDAGEGLDDATGGVSYLAPRRAGETVKAGPELVNMDAFGTTAASWYWILISIRPDTYTAPAVGKKADRGQASNTTTATSTAVAMAAAGSISTGNYLIARIGLDNAGTSGAAPSCTITDPRSNTWTVVGPANRTAASAANDGSTCYIAYAKVTNAYTSGDSLTVNHSPTTPAKAINVEEWYGIDATTPVAVTSTTATGSSATPSIVRTPLAAGQLFYGAISAEGPATDAFTQDTDTTDGSWVTLTRVASANATAASNQDIYGVAKLVTGTTAQTWNPNIGTSRDWAQIALVFAPTAASGTAEGGVSYSAGASQATQVKVAPQGAVCSSAAAPRSIAVRVAKQSANAAAAALSTALRSTQSRAQGSAAATAAAASATQVKVAKQSASCSTSVAAQATGRKVIAKAGAVAGAASIAATGAKRTAAAGTSAAAASIQGRATKKSATSGTANSAVATAATGRKVIAAAGQAYAAAFTYRSIVILPRAVSATCSAAVSGSARATKATAVGAVVAGAAGARGNGVKRATPSALASAAGSCRSTAQKKTAATGTASAAAAAVGQLRKAAVARGTSYAAGYCEGRRRALSPWTFRPNTGITDRPIGAPPTTVRPDSGTTQRPVILT